MFLYCCETVIFMLKKPLRFIIYFTFAVIFEFTHDKNR